MKTDLRSGEVAAVLGFSDRTIRRLADAGILPSRRLTPRSERRYPVSGVVELLCRRAG